MADIILLGLAALCTAYFLIIVISSGIGTSFAFIWLFFAALSLFLVYGKWYYSRNLIRIPRWVPVSIVTTCAAGAAVMLLICIQIFFGAASPDRGGLDYVIVLGARVKEHTVSNSLKKRLDKAIEYAQRHPETILVLSGGKGPDEPVSEASAMYDYLVYNGIPKKQLLLEEQSVSTAENIAYSKVVIENHRRRVQEEKARKEEKRALRTPDTQLRGRKEGSYLVAADKPLEIGVLTSNFHVYRAKMTAKKRGFEHVTGIGAPSDPVLFVHLCVRECASVFKDRLMGNM